MLQQLHMVCYMGSKFARMFLKAYLGRLQCFASAELQVFWEYWITDYLNFQLIKMHSTTRQAPL